MSRRTPTRWLGGGLAVLLGTAGPVLAQPAAPPAAARPATAALVNGEAIPLAEVEAVISQRPPSATPLTSQQQRQIRADVLNALIDDLLLKQFLRAKGPKVEPAEVDQQFAALGKAMQAQNKTLADFLKETGQTEAQVRASIHVMLQFDRYVKAQCSDAEMQKYYEAYKDFFDQVKVKASHIVLRLPTTASPGEREQARQKLLALKADLAAGKIDFAAAAKANSHCPSAAEGGDIGEVPRKFLVEEAFAKAAFALKVGEVSDPVETEFGVHLIKVTGRTPPVPSTFAGCADEVRSVYCEEYRQGMLASIRKTAQIQVMLP